MRKSLKQQALDHYDKMIAWVETKSKIYHVRSISMENKIGEWWNGNSCSYCNEFRTNLKECPLNSLKDYENCSCCNDLWLKMHNAKTWKTWLKYAKLVREYIKENG